MSQSARTAIFGVTPLSLTLGRACCLNDRPPVGLYDPDPQNALRGALFLGISARQQPSQLDPPETPLEVAIIGHALAGEGLRRLSAREDLLVISLVPLEVKGFAICLALTVSISEEETETISATIPEIVFTLQAGDKERERAHDYLRALSPGISVLRQAL